MERGMESMRLLVRMEVHWEDVSCRLSADVVGKGIPRPADFTGRERRVRSSGGIVEGVDPPRSEGRKFFRIASSTGANCSDMLSTTRWMCYHSCW